MQLKYVYILKSIHTPAHTYVGLTSNLRQRLEYHNSGRSFHTSKFRPWKVQTYIGFSDHQKAALFEKYLKSGSGRAFWKKRL